MTQIARHGFNVSTSMRSLPKRFSLSLLAFCLGSSFIISEANAQQTAKPSPTLSYQASINKVGPLTLTARLYSDANGENLVWEETSELTSVAGVINVELGSSVALPVAQMDQQLYLGISIDGSEELRPLTKLAAAPLALNVPDGAITKSKIGTSYIESITINGRKIEGNGAALKIETGRGITAGYDEGSNTILLGSASSRGKGTNGTLADETIDGNLIVNGNTDLGGSAIDPTITFTGKAASSLDMDGNDIHNVGSIHVGDILSLDGATLTLGGLPGTAGQVLTSQGSGMNPVWTSPAESWSQGGSAGTTAGADFLGTADDEPFEIHIDATGTDAEGRGRIGRFEPNDVSANIVFGHNQNYLSSGVVGATIGGGGDYFHINEVLMDFGTIGGGRANAVSQFATVSGGEYNMAMNTYATVGGGYENNAQQTNTTIAGGYSNWARSSGATIGGGEENTARGNLSTIGGGYSNRTNSGASTIGGGEWNLTQSLYSTIAGGSNNYTDGFGATIGGGVYNTASALHGTVGGGEYNTVNGPHSVIPGGRYLTLGQYSFGFNADPNNDQTDLSAMSNVAYFGNTDLMLGNVDNAARSLKFYEPNASMNYAGTNYTSFKAPALGENVEYTLPANQGVANSVLRNDGSGVLSWQPMTLGGDVTGLLGTNVVNSVGGQSAASIATAVANVNAAGAVNVASTLVRRDASGNFAAGTITANLVGNVTGNLTGNVTGSATSFTGALQGDVVGSQGTTQVVSVGGVSATEIAAVATLASTATSDNVANTVVKRDASGQVALGSVTTTDGITLGGTLKLSTTSIAGSTSGITLPDGHSLVMITGTLGGNFNYTLPSGVEGQLLYVYNITNRRANNPFFNINAGTMKSFVFANGNWVPVG